VQAAPVPEAPVQAAPVQAAHKVILATVGSLGDLHPFMALSLALRARGLTPVLATAEDYRAKVEAAGITFQAMRPSFGELERDLGLSRPALVARCIADHEFLLGKVVLPYARAAYEDLLAAGAGADLFVTSTLCFGARLAAERLGIPVLAVVLQPMMFMSAYDPPVIPRAEFLKPLLRLLGPTVAAGVLGLGKSITHGLFLPLARLRAELQLAPDPRHPLFEGQFSSVGALGLYSRALGSVRPDYPVGAAVVGFASFDSEDGREARLGSALEDFLGRGPAPLVFTLGSLIVNNPGGFFRESVAAARRLGMRAVLLVGSAAQDGAAGLGLRPGADLLIDAYAPHSLLFPRAAAIVHQVGIGTLAQALRSGRPQLTVPFFADQLDNAARAVELGVARSISPPHYDAARVTRELRRLLEAPRFAARARQVREQLLKEDGAAAAADAIVTLLQSCRLERRGAATPSLLRSEADNWRAAH
jgi:UDP:flavonoid glycosyltransferase YjiC (YdhE family)